ncbi:NAD(P)-dependent dehydrogenase (short-subunit alcohol dehydrogenase family) [Paraburkholderia unamae]|uniref:SDR family NAD(P)-dependent oxidoreductase n=1 Tax=Paraburkholderia unamae TaxID=219649 RepID=UPI000DC59313|nr:SDR family oxidoreductase [Paraburkholderia unamae]RAR48264.1 NAD(P)-dependent dehydrogenase (short-subunit alcohol dehydrogenase family) [Paraburkholderia unamae]
MTQANKRLALVTGGNQGIGLATVKRLLGSGVQVLAVDLADDNLLDFPVHRLVLDLAASDAPARIVDAITTLGSGLDILVNNAGVGGSKRLADSDDALIDRIVDINLRAVLRLTRDCLPLMNSGAAIVNVASVFGEVGFPGSTAYAVTKAGISQFTRQLASEISGKGIRVNAVAPGLIRTPMTEARLERDASYRDAMLGATPLRRVGLPEDVASVIGFLVGEDASFVNGQVIAVDGGWLTCRYLD